MGLQSEPVGDFQSSSPLRSHSGHKDIHRDFLWEGPEGAVLWSGLRLDSVGRKVVRHSRTQIGPVDLLVWNETHAESLCVHLESRASLVYVALET